MDRRVRTNESGSILIFAALMMTALMGVLALAIDGSYLYAQRNQLAAAADAAAKAGAQELRRVPTITTARLLAFAKKETALNGFTSGGAVTVVANHPPKSGPFNGLPDYVEVTVSRTTTTFFSGVLGFASITPMARAVAGKGSTPVCVVALSKAGTGGLAGAAISVGGELGSSTCSVVANGDLQIQNGASVVANSIALAGECNDGTPATCPAWVQEFQTIATDPLANLTFPSAPAGVSCVPYTLVNGATGSATMPAGGWQCYTQIITGGSSHLTLPAGNYYVTGDISLGNSGTIDGSNVSIFLTGTASSFHLGGGSLSIATLSAPTSGPYAGIVFFQDPLNHTNASFGNGSFFNFSGALYLPAADLVFGGGGTGGASADCAIMVARQITLSNSTTFKNGCAAYGGSVLGTKSAVAE